MRNLSLVVLFLAIMGSTHGFNLAAFDEAGASKESAAGAAPISGFRDVAAEREIEKRFLAVPDPKLAEEHLRILTASSAHGRHS